MVLHERTLGKICVNSAPMKRDTTLNGFNEPLGLRYDSEAKRSRSYKKKMNRHPGVTFPLKAAMSFKLGRESDGIA